MPIWHRSALSPTKSVLNSATEFDTAMTKSYGVTLCRKRQVRRLHGNSPMWSASSVGVGGSVHSRFVIDGCRRRERARSCGGDFGIESVPRKERICALLPRARVLHTGERASVPCQQARRSLNVGPRLLDGASGNRLLRRHAINALPRKLEPQSALAARPRAIPRFDPRSREGLVVEHPEVDKPGDGTLDQLVAVADAAQPSPNLADRSLAGLEEPQRRLEHDRRIVHRAEPLALLVEPLAPPSSIRHYRITN